MGGEVVELREDGTSVPIELVVSEIEVGARRLVNRIVGDTGSGLSLVKSMVDMHGGTMAIESGLDAGTLVTIMFPKNRTFSIR